MDQFFIKQTNKMYANNRSCFTFVWIGSDSRTFVPFLLDEMGEIFLSHSNSFIKWTHDSHIQVDALEYAIEIVELLVSIDIEGPIFFAFFFLKWSANRNGSVITAGYTVERMLYSTIDELINFMVKRASMRRNVWVWNWVRQANIVGHIFFL